MSFGTGSRSRSSSRLAGQLNQMPLRIRSNVGGLLVAPVFLGYSGRTEDPANASTAWHNDDDRSRAGVSIHLPLETLEEKICEGFGGYGNETCTTVVPADHLTTFLKNGDRTAVLQSVGRTSVYYNLHKTSSNHGAMTSEIGVSACCQPKKHSMHEMPTQPIPVEGLKFADGIWSSNDAMKQ